VSILAAAAAPILVLEIPRPLRPEGERLPGRGGAAAYLRAGSGINAVTVRGEAFQVSRTKSESATLFTSAATAFTTSLSGQDAQLLDLSLSPISNRTDFLLASLIPRGLICFSEKLGHSNIDLEFI
jgi:hypothetical protein